MPATTPRFLIDGVFFQIGRSGIARVWTQVFAQWLASGFARNVVVVNRQHTLPALPGLQTVDAPAFNYEHAEADRHMLQSLCDQLGIAAFASTYYTQPLHTPTLLLVHDMIPEVLGWDLNEPMWRQKQQALRQATAFAAVSDHTARDLRRHLALPDLPVAKIPNGCDLRPASPEAVIAFRQRHGLIRPYFMLSGSRDDYKNAALFFDAFAQLGDARSQYGVLCTGGGEIGARARQLIADATLHVGILSDEDMAPAYSGAIALVYPSLYEGFGLPVLEAMACACPVVCTDAASLPEVGGDAPLYLPLAIPEADRPVALAKHLQAVQQASVRQQAVARGLQQAQRFSWRATAHGLAEALSAIAHPSAHVPAVQRASRLHPDDQLFDVEGLHIALPVDHLLPRYQREHLLYDRFLPELARHLAPDSLVIDVGANCGDTVAAMCRAQPALHHLCVEPDEGFYRYLEHNARRLQQAHPGVQLHLVQALVGQAGQHATLAGGGGSKHATLHASSQSTPANQLATESLDDIVARSAGRTERVISLIKSDVDGHDHDVLASATGLIARHAPLLYFECQATTETQLAQYKACIDTLAAQGYTDFWLFDNYGNLLVQASLPVLVHQVFDYIWRQARSRATRTMYYVDILAATPSQRPTAQAAVTAYLAAYEGA